MPPPLSSMHTSVYVAKRPTLALNNKLKVQKIMPSQMEVLQDRLKQITWRWWTWRLTGWLRRWQTQTWWWKQKLTISGETGPDHLAYLAYLKGSFAIYNVLWWPSLFSSAHGTGLKELTLCILFDKIKTRIRFHSRDQLVFLSHPNECDWARMTENWSLRRRPDWRQGRGSKSNWKQPQNNLLVKW